MSGRNGPVEQGAAIRTDLCSVNRAPAFTGPKGGAAHRAEVTAYPLPSRHPSMACPSPQRIAYLIAVAAAVEAIGGGGAAAMLCDLALIAVVVAATERRHAAMLVAAGIACVLAPFGAMLLPLAIGIVVQRRIGARTLLLIPAAAGATMLAMQAVPLFDGGTSIGLWAVLQDPRAYGLLIATALGTLGWLAAAFTARPLTARDSAAAATVAALVFALVAPHGSMAVPVALAIFARDRRIPILATVATALAALAYPVPATLVLVVALVVAARAVFRPAANDNPVSGPVLAQRGEQRLFEPRGVLDLR